MIGSQHCLMAASTSGSKSPAAKEALKDSDHNSNIKHVLIKIEQVLSTF